jgi:excisionase family DNA binding protein
VSIEREYQTPPQAAALVGVSHSKITGWIATGELVAIDLSTGRNARPRWHISREELDAFLARRSSKPAPRLPPRRKADPSVTQYY